MKKYLVLLMLVLCSILANAIVYDVDNIPVPDNSGEGSVSYISNPDGILDDEACVYINAVLLDLEKTAGIKSLVIAVRSVKDGDLYRLTTDVGNKYGIGSKDNTGIIMAIAIDDKEWRIVTGEGMEKYLTDAEASYIGRHCLVPYMKLGEYSEGMKALVDAVVKSLKGDEELKEKIIATEEAMKENEGMSGERTDDSAGEGLLMFLLVGSVIMLVWDVVKWYRRSHYDGKCPVCGCTTGKKIATERNGVIVEYDYQCEKCNEYFTVRVFFYIFVLYYILRILISLRGGGSGGSSGGRSYGSRGGGSFGGGGAGGRW